LASAPAALAEPVAVEARPVALDDRDPTVAVVGRLRFRGGLALRSGDERFGGLSALRVAPDGGRAIALSDHGHRFEMRLRYDGLGDLAGVVAADGGALGGLDGRPLTGFGERDAEAMTFGAGGELIVAFERQHRIWRYFPGEARPEPLPPPRELAKAPYNGGIEALTTLADGRLLALTESYGGADARVGWVSDADGWSPLTYAVDGGFEPTDATTLPGGDVLVLERRFSLRGGVAARLKRLDAGQVAPGAHLVGRALAVIEPPLAVDNMEGVDVRLGPRGETLIYMVSDDNFSPSRQRTLLLMFELIE
jgi:hypothetical protein